MSDHTDARDALQLVNGYDHSSPLAPAPTAIDTGAIRQLVRTRDVAKKLGVSISWVIQHASGKRSLIFLLPRWDLAEAP